MRTGDTIVAIASPPGRAARGVIRASGPGVPALLTEVLEGDPPVGASAARFRLPPRSFAVLVARYAAPRSYTGEDAAELLLPGNPALLERVLARLVAFEGGGGVRLAEPGEFTARAYLAGKLTLDQAEGVAATISAESDEQLRGARALLEGSSGAAYRAWAEEVATLAALVEAGIDFTDQEDVVPIAPADLQRRLRGVQSSIEACLGPRTGEVRESEPRVVLAGEPNAGKSTLFNALLGRRRAVVSPLAGTTRDVLQEPLDLAGVLPGAGRVLLVDVAGVRDGDAGTGSGSEPDAAIAAEADARARAAIREADAVIHCDPSGRFPPLGVGARTTVIRVRTKADLPEPAGASGESLAVCALDGWNLPVLRRALADAAWGGAFDSAAAVLPRHRRALVQALEAMCQAHARADGDERALGDPAAVADALRGALDALGELTGRISPDDVIGRVFATFCVGK